MAPVLVLKVKPAGKPGLMAQPVIVPPVLVGVQVLIAVPAVKLLLDGVYDMIGGFASTLRVTVVLLLPPAFVAVMV